MTEWVAGSVTGISVAKWYRNSNRSGVNTVSRFRKSSSSHVQARMRKINYKKKCSRTDQPIQYKGSYFHDKRRRDSDEHMPYTGGSKGRNQS